MNGHPGHRQEYKKRAQEGIDNSTHFFL